MTTASHTSRFLDMRALAALAHMRFTTRHRVEGSYSGRHQSRQQGGAGEFVDYREYTGGEDLRRLDWKVLARTGKAFVRLHQEETNLVCNLAIDASGSMQFAGNGQGRRRASKLEYAQYLATALAYVISLGQDQVGLAVLRQAIGQSPPARQHGAARRAGHGIYRANRNRTDDALGPRTTRPVRANDPPRRVDAVFRFSHGRFRRHVRGATIVSPSRAGSRRPAPDSSRRRDPAPRHGVSVRGLGERRGDRLFAGRDSLAISATLFSAHGDGSPNGPGRRLRLPTRVDRRAIFGNAGRVFSRTIGLSPLSFVLSHSP